MSVLFEFAMFPTDKGESVSSYVARIVTIIDRASLSYKLTPMGTIVEVERLDEALEIIRMAYAELEPDCSRVYSVVKFDIRKGGTDRLKGKIESVEQKAGIALKT